MPSHMSDNRCMSEITSMRLDKWLWAARFYKTRSLAVEQISKNRVSVNAAAAKASREVRVGDTIALRQGDTPKTVQVLGLSAIRGPAPVAQQLYQETEASVAERVRLAEQRRLAPEPASAIAMQHDGRPTKRDRRDIERTRHQWDDRWSASWDGQ
jgi:ribosome-associated heat shock protein Hsp15